MREKTINQNNRFRLITGTFPDKETAEIMAEELKIRYSYLGEIGKLVERMTELELQDIKGSYEVIISLGSWCGPSLNLRRSSFPLDWVVSYSLPDVSRILKNRFAVFMDLKNMKQVDGIDSYLDGGDVVFSDEGGKQQKAHFIQDTYYNVISVHVFPMIPNQDWTHLYPA